MLERARKTLNKNDIRFDEIKIDRNQNKLPFDDNSFDLIMSFYSLEHIYPLDKYLEELNRVLRKNGRLIGAIPAEGGLAWGMGRYLTSRRWFLKNTTINPDKIICWQHPNFADHILSSLDEKFEKIKLAYWPMRVPIVDINLVVKFIYKKK